MMVTTMMARRLRAIGHCYDSDENMTMMTTTLMLMLMMMMILMLITILMAVNRTGGHDYGGGAVDDGNDGRCNDDNPDVAEVYGLGFRVCHAS